MPRKLTLEIFIERARQLYGDKYDYSKVVYINSETKVCITCPKHGDFWMSPNNFLNNHKCPTCSGRQRITRDVFIDRSTRKHNGRYDYSKVDYHGLNVPVTIICPIHGEFQQKPSGHMNGNGCPACFGDPKSTTEEFIKKAKEIYGERYDYSKVVYKGNKEKVCIICPEHGEFWMSPNNHLRGHRCPGCFGTPKLTTEQFIERAREVHGNLYDYSMVDYQGLQKKVCLVCPEHGEFWTTPDSHLQGHRCPYCYGKLKLTTEQFLSRTKAVHQGRYDYSKVDYQGLNKKVCIICREHGEFWMTPASHLQGHGCPVCSGTQRITVPIFIERCTKIHNGKYDYTFVDFKHLQDFVKIICPIHGEYWQRALVHYRGYGCPICGGSKRLTNEEFIEKARLVHEDKYDYSKVQYKNTSTKVCIICPEHGEFWQTPNNHLFGAGCPTCPESNMESAIRHLLLTNNIVFEQEKGFDWLIYNRHMYLDFFLPEYGVAIECQGGQHFFPSKLFGGEDFYKLTVERDMIKKKLCEEHGIRILYYSNAHIDYPYPVFESMRMLLKAIKEKGIVEDSFIWGDRQLSFDFED